MATVSWPASLPPPETRGFRFDHGEALVLFEPAAGPPKARPRGAMASDRVAMSLVVDEAGRTTFRTFYVQTTKRGALPFDMDEPGTSTPAEWLFVEPPTEEPMAGGTWWRIRFTLARIG